MVKFFENVSNIELELQCLFIILYLQADFNTLVPLGRKKISLTKKIF